MKKHEKPEYKLIKNSAQCKLCGDILISEHGHDFRSCKCGNLSVDGGLEYLRRCFKQVDSYNELSYTEVIKKKGKKK